MFDKPMLILPLPEGIRSHNSFGSLSTLLIVGFGLFIYIDQTRGIPALDASIKSTKKAKKEDTPSAYASVVPEQLDVDVPIEEHTSNVQKEDIAPRPTYVVVKTDDTRMRNSPERIKGNVLDIIDIGEKLIFTGQYHHVAETFRRNDGQYINGYWLYVFRPKTNAYGWVHQVNL